MLLPFFQARTVNVCLHVDTYLDMYVYEFVSSNFIFLALCKSFWNIHICKAIIYFYHVFPTICKIWKFATLLLITPSPTHSVQTQVLSCLHIAIFPGIFHLNLIHFRYSKINKRKKSIYRTEIQPIIKKKKKKNVTALFSHQCEWF